MEAMRINFHVYGPDPRTFSGYDARYAIRIFAGGVNAVSGEPIKANMSTILKRLNGIEKSQDYIYVRGGKKPSQQWLDGIATEDGVVRQFVAVSGSSPSTVEQQVTGFNSVGGIQIEVIPQHKNGRFTIYKRDSISATEYDPIWTQRLESCSELGIPVGTRIYAEETLAKNRERQLIDEIDWASPELKASRTIELNIWPPAISNETTFHISASFAYEAGTLGPVEVYPETTVDFVQDQICYHSGIVPSMYKMGKREADFFRMSYLEGNPTLKQAGLMPGGDTLLFMDRLRGGGATSSDYSPMMGIAPGARIKQHIVPDREDPRSWSTEEACLINVQFVDSKVFKLMTGFDAPPSPISANTYLDRGIPFSQNASELRGSIKYGLGSLQAVAESLPALFTRSSRTSTLPGYCQNCINNWACRRYVLLSATVDTTC
jgi:hypothetical protein